MKPQPVRIHIATGDARPIFKQIVDEIRIKIAKGELPTGTKLPSVRALAMQLSVNPNTVAKAYGELATQGFLESRKGLGIFVKERNQILSLAERNKRLDTAIDAFMNEVVHLDIPREAILARLDTQLKTVLNDQEG